MKRFFMLAIASVLIGCQSNPPVNIQDSFTAQYTTAKVRIGTFDYEKILIETSLNKLLKIERYGIYERPDKAGNVEFIRLRMRLIGSGKKAGKKITDDEELLDFFLHRITVLLAEKTAVDRQNIELIMRVGDCQIHALAGNLKDIKCDKLHPVRLLKPGFGPAFKRALYIVNREIKYNDCLKKEVNQDSCYKRDYLLTTAKLKNFCETTLRRKLKDYTFTSDCEVEHSQSGEFSINQIRVDSYLTGKYWEMFSIKISYKKGNHEEKIFDGYLEIADGKCRAKLGKKAPSPSSFKKPLHECGQKDHSTKSIKERELVNSVENYFN